MEEKGFSYGQKKEKRNFVFYTHQFNYCYVACVYQKKNSTTGSAFLKESRKRL